MSARPDHVCYMPGYKKEQEDRRLLAFSASPAQDLGAFEMSSLSEVTGSFLLLSPQRPATDEPQAWRANVACYQTGSAMPRKSRW